MSGRDHGEAVAVQQTQGVGDARRERLNRMGDVLLQCRGRADGSTMKVEGGRLRRPRKQRAVQITPRRVWERAQWVQVHPGPSTERGREVVETRRTSRSVAGGRRPFSLYPALKQEAAKVTSRIASINQLKGFNCECHPLSRLAVTFPAPFRGPTASRILILNEMRRESFQRGVCRVYHVS